MSLPVDFAVRRAASEDLEAILQMIRAAELADYGTAEFSASDLLSEWRKPRFRLETNTWVIAAPAGQITGYIEAWDRIEHVYIQTWGTVHPGFRGQGIGTRLLELSEDWARQRIPLAPVGARVAMTGAVEAPDQAGKRLMEQHGFRPLRSFWQLETELQAPPPAPEWPDGIAVTTFVPERDARAVFEAIEEAFEDHWGHSPTTFEAWRERRLARADFDPSLWFLALDGNQIAGVVLCREMSAEKGWVGQLAVRRPWRRRGLGMALLRYAFGEFYRQGKRRVGLGVDSQNLTGATRLYERAGMRVVRQRDAYMKVLRPGTEPGETGGERNR